MEAMHFLAEFSDAHKTLLSKDVICFRCICTAVQTTNDLTDIVHDGRILGRDTLKKRLVMKMSIVCPCCVYWDTTGMCVIWEVRVDAWSQTWTLWSRAGSLINSSLSCLLTFQIVCDQTPLLDWQGVHNFFWNAVPAEMIMLSQGHFAWLNETVCWTCQNFGHLYRWELGERHMRDRSRSCLKVTVFFAVQGRASHWWCHVCNRNEWPFSLPALPLFAELGNSVFIQASYLATLVGLKPTYSEVSTIERRNSIPRAWLLWNEFSGSDHSIFRQHAGREGIHQL